MSRSSGAGSRCELLNEDDEIQLKVPVQDCAVRVWDVFGGGGSDLADLAIMLVIAIPVIAYDLYESSKHNYEGVGKATLVLDGCGDCGSFWFDKGEIDRISKAHKVGDGMGI